MTDQAPTRRPRVSRETTHHSREQETWDAAAIHDTYDDVWVQQGNMPDVEPRNGFEQRWIRSTIGGEPDPLRLATAAQQGWRRRDPGTLPKKLGPLADYVEGIGGVIGVSGMILMERPKKLGEVYKRKKEERNEAHRRSVDENLFKVHDANSGFGPPRRVEDRTRVSRGKRPAPIADD